MGFDIFGKGGNDDDKAYFRANVWWWRPLWQYCESIGHEIIPQDNFGSSNDGWGLGEADSIKLADLLQAEIDSGRTLAYEKAYEEHLISLPDERCKYCEGTGTRKDKVAVAAGDHDRLIDREGHPRNGEHGWCNACDGVGHSRPFQTNYPFTAEFVGEFVDFLRKCGGFEIW